MLSLLLKHKHRTGKSGCYLPNCRICGPTKKYLQDKAKYKLLRNILPKNSASYLRNLAVPNYTVSSVPEILLQKKDYTILVQIYDLLIRHVKAKHNGYVLLGCDFPTYIEKYTKEFYSIDFFIFSSFKIDILMTCIPDLFENVAKQLEQRGYEAFVYSSETLVPLKHFNRIEINFFCHIVKPDKDNITAKFNDINKDLGQYTFCIHIPNGKNKDSDIHSWNPFDFKKNRKHSWLKDLNLNSETQETIEWITRAKRLTHNFFLGTMFDSVLHPDGKRIFRFGWPELTNENDYMEEVAYENAYIEQIDNNHAPVINENNKNIMERQPKFPVKSLFTLAWQNIPTKYDD